MNRFSEAILVPREVIEVAPEILPAIIKGAQKAGMDWAEMMSAAGKGRYGDTEVAHVTPEEGQWLEAMGGAGTTNPQTGMKEYYRPDVGRDDVGGRGVSGPAESGSGGTGTGRSAGAVSRMPSTAAPPASGPGGPGYTSPSVAEGRDGAPGVTITRKPGAGRVLPPGADPTAREVREGATQYPRIEQVSAPQLSGLATGELGPGDVAPTGSERVVGYWYPPRDVTTGAVIGGAVGMLGPPGGAAAGAYLGNKYIGGDTLFRVPGGYVDLTREIEGRDPGGAGTRGAMRGGFPTETFIPEQIRRWVRPALRTPAERFGFETGMNPLQQRVAIATRGTSGLDSYYRSREAMDYYRNLLQRALITDQGELGGLSELRPIEQQYLDLMGVPSRTTTEGLLEALAAA